MGAEVLNLAMEEAIVKQLKLARKRIKETLGSIVGNNVSGRKP